jgi:hypothetical protein
VLDGCEHGGIISAEGRQVPEARAVYTRILTAANISASKWATTTVGRSPGNAGVVAVVIATLVGFGTEARHVRMGEGALHEHTR